VTTIDPDRPLLTFINVFSCEPEHQDELAATLERETERHVRNLPGFVSANIHRSLDGLRVVNYAQWEDLAAFQEMMQGETGRAVMAAVHRFATSADVHLYEVRSVVGAGVEVVR